MKKVIVFLIMIIVPMSLLSGCYQAGEVAGNALEGTVEVALGVASIPLVATEDLLVVLSE